jgi:hypothetical protein
MQRLDELDTTLIVLAIAVVAAFGIAWVISIVRGAMEFWRCWMWRFNPTQSDRGVVRDEGPRDPRRPADD